jgi:RNA-directed DNA polymerase
MSDLQAAPERRARQARFVHIQTAADAAALLGVPAGALIHALYRAAATERYTRFEIPKRGGGMRLIASPNGIVRRAQMALAPILQDAYEAHPAAMGFLKERSILTNAQAHAGQNLVLNVDLKDFFPSINFGRVRGLFMAAPFGMGPAAATVLAQLCTDRNGLPQGAPTSPPLSNLIAAGLDRRLSRLARANRVRYTRYADDITFSTKEAQFPPALAMKLVGPANAEVQCGPALAAAIQACGLEVNPKKVRLQSRHTRQSVTGLTVNAAPNVERSRVRRLRAMLHAWEKFGLEAAGIEHFARWKPNPASGQVNHPGRRFRNAVYGELAYLKMVRGAADPVFLRLCARLIDLDPNPSRFIRQMVFGANDFDVFISHASEDKEAIARPIYEACAARGIKAFLDEDHIAWGESFTRKINLALGAARTVVAVVSSHSVSKDWPLTEMNTALSMEVNGQKKVLPVMVGKPDLLQLPLLRGKNHVAWTGDAEAVAARIEALVRPPKPASSPGERRNGGGFARMDQAARSHGGLSVPPVGDYPPQMPSKPRFSLWSLLFGRRRG